MTKANGRLQGNVAIVPGAGSVGAERQRWVTPCPSWGDGRDTANAALFLASDEARFVTGTEIIDGA